MTYGLLCFDLGFFSGRVGDVHWEGGLESVLEAPSSKNVSVGSWDKPKWAELLKPLTLSPDVHWEDSELSVTTHRKKKYM